MWRWEDAISLIVKERCVQLWVIFMSPLFIWLPLHQSMDIPHMHRSINNVYILIGCAVMYIPAIIGGLLSSLCISSPMTFTQPQAFRPCYYDKYIILLWEEMENGMQPLTVFKPSCNLQQTDLLTKIIICGYKLVINALKLFPEWAWLCIWSLLRIGNMIFSGFISDQKLFLSFPQFFYAFHLFASLSLSFA